MKEEWKAQWIGYEEPGQWSSASLVRNGLRIATRARRAVTRSTTSAWRFSLARQVKHADLFVTGKDTAAAWVNGKQVLQAQPLPPWKQAPWKTYLKQDVTTGLHTGDNLLAVGVTLYGTPSANGMGSPDDDHTPMSAYASSLYG